ncbi:DUF4291 domain-containing protein [Winogradskyella sp. SYSU M77433]|uniref:DUF4291 domain-containing protein n=1 Tax=Winogradskyella sp. SYSU M77433 TaxID=3042722 RepID=UPI002480F802|nr:DUF4291 domain-containing protein [Winogradskyella sp. SYSU M77433]MDH7911882.1 DUF4291 domain-containing protein [Winogradskyella sp. SYSU M77433]
MKLKIKLYNKQIEKWPQQGHHIMAQYDNQKIIVYQSYRPEIGDFAVQNQYFGGAFSQDRMTWIKPNFLWMVYRNGWATKVGQEVVLAIHLKREAFERYLKQAVYSSYQSDLYVSREEWQKKVKSSSIRLQWDPDHNPYGAKLERRAIQIGIRGKEAVNYAKDDILEIEDITPFVKEQYQFVLNKQLDQLMIPEEYPLVFNDEVLNKNLRLQ